LAVNVAVQTKDGSRYLFLQNIEILPVKQGLANAQKGYTRVLEWNRKGHKYLALAAAAGQNGRRTGLQQTASGLVTRRSAFALTKLAYRISGDSASSTGRTLEDNGLYCDLLAKRLLL
jgi:hypothetical protein